MLADSPRTPRRRHHFCGDRMLRCNFDAVLVPPRMHTLMSSRLGEILVKESLIICGSAEAGARLSEEEWRPAGDLSGEAGIRQRRRHHRSSFPPVRRSLHQSEVLRSRSRRHQADPAGYGRPLPDRSALARRLDADHRDDRSHERLRDGRYQVHDRLQRRAGGGVRNGDQRSDPQVLRRRRKRAKNSTR